MFWFIGTLAMQLLATQRTFKSWEVPLVPWLPSLSIRMNIFLVITQRAMTSLCFQVKEEGEQEQVFFVSMT